MKKIVFALSAVVLLSVTNLKAQDAFDTQMKAYKLALKNYDLQAATVCLYQAIALKPERKDLNDSMALLYFAGERYAQALS